MPILVTNPVQLFEAASSYYRIKQMQKASQEQPITSPPTPPPQPAPPAPPIIHSPAKYFTQMSRYMHQQQLYNAYLYEQKHPEKAKQYLQIAKFTKEHPEVIHRLAVIHVLREQKALPSNYKNMTTEQLDELCKKIYREKYNFSGNIEPAGKPSSFAEFYYAYKEVYSNPQSAATITKLSSTLTKDLNTTKSGENATSVTTSTTHTATPKGVNISPQQDLFTQLEQNQQLTAQQGQVTTQQAAINKIKPALVFLAILLLAALG